MLRYLAENCTGILIANEVIPQHKKNIYVYGFELLWSFVLFAICAVVFSVVFGYSKLLITFLMFFVPIRVVGGGYHAKSYRSCFILSNFVAIAGVCLSKALWKWERDWLDAFLWIVLFMAVTYIWRRVPVVSEHHPLKETQIRRNRKYAHVVLVLDLSILVVMESIGDRRMVYAGIVAMCFVACFIRTIKKVPGGKNL